MIHTIKIEDNPKVDLHKSAFVMNNLLLPGNKAMGGWGR
jgi:hypothetical protein